jgi:sulfide:quinone oxidoreductase
MIQQRTRVLVAGGGVAGLEALLALQALAGDRVQVELLAPERSFEHRPLAVSEPFRAGAIQRLPLQAIADERGVPLHRDGLARVHHDERRVETMEGASLPYDALVLALGARPVEALPGALTFRGPQDGQRMRALLIRLGDDAQRRLAFVVPEGTSWTMPLYELALLMAAKVPEAEVRLVTPEPEPLAAFGPEVSAVVAEFLAERGIELRTGAIAVAHELGGVVLDSGAKVPADHVVALPRLVGPHLRGVPSDPLGFVPVDEYTRVLGLENMHAVGDLAANGIKQGGLAAQQADVAAAVIAAGAGAPVEPQPFRPVLRGMLLTGGVPRYLRHERKGASAASEGEPLWWPPAKIAGRHLAPYLAARMPLDEPPAGAGVSVEAPPVSGAAAR